MNAVAAAMRICSRLPTIPERSEEEVRQDARQWHEWKQREKTREALELKIENDTGKKLWDDARVDGWVDATTGRSITSSNSEASWQTPTTVDQTVIPREGESSEVELKTTMRPVLNALLLEVKLAALKRKAKMIKARLEANEQIDALHPMSFARNTDWPPSHHRHMKELSTELSRNTRARYPRPVEATHFSHQTTRLTPNPTLPVMQARGPTIPIQCLLDLASLLVFEAAMVMILPFLLLLPLTLRVLQAIRGEFGDSDVEFGLGELVVIAGQSEILNANWLLRCRSFP